MTSSSGRTNQKESTLINDMDDPDWSNELNPDHEKTQAPLTKQELRQFNRCLRASDMKDFLKSGCDMGWYQHFVGLHPIDLKYAYRILEPFKHNRYKKKQQPSVPI